MKAQVITVILFLVVSTTSCANDEEVSPIEVLYEWPSYRRIFREFLRFLESEYEDPPIINPGSGSNTESSTSTISSTGSTSNTSSTAQSTTPAESSSRSRSKGGGHPHKETKNHHLHAKQHHKNEYKEHKQQNHHERKHKQENHHEREHPHHPQQNY